jgi:uncharacterized protein (TIGR02145 family)
MRNLALMWVLAGCLLGCGGWKDAKDKAALAADTVVIAPDTDTTFTDSRDGKVYRKIAIGGQTWMAENLNYAAKGSKCYNNKAENCAKHGRLYTWETAFTACPAGTHLPTDKEWTILVDYVGGDEMAGTKLKSVAGWNEDGGGMNDYGWSALSGGYGYSDGRFITAGSCGHWWSATERSANYAKSWSMYSNAQTVGWDYNGKTYLLSVRCVQDDEKERRK